MNKSLHIVAFNVPIPADYGGVIDVFYKIKALHKIGIDIHLHCFIYRRDEGAVLKQYCKTVSYYDRKNNYRNFLSKTPYIVKSRVSKSLLNNLKKDSFPVLFEGVHCTASYNQIAKNNSQRKLFIRAHNIEHLYYKELFQIERKILKKVFFYFESKKLKVYERKIFQNNPVFAISNSDFNFLISMDAKVKLINPFHINEEVCSNLEIGSYALFHGNLEVLDNELSALFFVNIFKNLHYKLVIAGRNPSINLIETIKKYKNIELVTNPNDQQILGLIKNAQINVFYSNQSSGIKLKLINALFNGRLCYINKNFVVNDIFSSLCRVVNNDDEWENEIDLAFESSLSKYDIELRKKKLESFKNNHNANLIAEAIFA
ncbi:MAG: hypothetical protein ACJ0QO_00865 [Parvicellaceae bacterium]